MRLGRWSAHMAHGGRRSPLLGWQECSAGQMLIGKREHRTSNAEHPTPNQREKTSRCSRCARGLDVRRSRWKVRCSNYLRCHRTGRVGSVTDNPAPMAHAAWRWSEVMNSRAPSTSALATWRAPAPSFDAHATRLPRRLRRNMAEDSSPARPSKLPGSGMALISAKLTDQPLSCMVPPASMSAMKRYQ